MAQTYVFPGNNTTYVPSLSLDIQVEFTRKEFPINRYVNVRKVDKEVGYYTQMRNDNQVRFTSPAQFVWADGADAPQVLGTGTDSFIFAPYSTNRYAYVSRLGYLSVEQGSWDILGQATRMRSSQGMTARSARVATAISLSTNYPTANYSATATALAGGAWSAATSAAPYIKKSILNMVKQIVLATNGVVQAKDLRVVFNPTTANIVSESQEFIDFLKQSPDSMAIFDGDNFNSRFGLPASLYGVELVVDDTVYISTAVGAATQTPTFTIADNVAVVLTKQNAISSSAGSAFSTFEILEYSPFEVFVYNDVLNRRYDAQVIENACEQTFAGQSGYLIANVSS